MPWGESFRGKSVLVTGASSGIGRAAAVAFGAAGARVALVARRRDRLEEVADEVRREGGEALVVAADVGDRNAVGACFASAIERFGRIDVAVSNAGVLIPGPVTEIEAADLEAMLRVNLFGSLYVLQEAVRVMRGQGGGSIVAVGSLAGRRGFSSLGGYCATKFALVGLIEALRIDLRGEPIHVALVLPGVVETPMVETLTQDQEFLDLWPSALNMPPSWVVWAIFAAARFQLLEVSVPPGAATLEKLAALSPGVADTVVHWAQKASRWLSEALPRGSAEQSAPEPLRSSHPEPHPNR
jgi:NAD(P)-dependent dehydrogenase (short-subunit alcohol dehydrogenase family)